MTMKKIVKRMRRMKQVLNKSKYRILFNTYRPLINEGIELDANDPREPEHLDLKFIRATEGPLV